MAPLEGGLPVNGHSGEVGEVSGLEERRHGPTGGVTPGQWPLR